ncbi:RNA polymerase sigma factor [Streptomyces sp. NPDC051954]|uniref:RNA polymerase sigma factor n=1 Tax=unclassified Streptomyces TaxID=2593676 RepID=UPI00341B29FB
MTDPGPPEDAGDSLSPVPVGGSGAGASEERAALPDRLSPEDEEAFSRFYRAYFARLTAYLVYQGASVHIASELVQDTMLKASRKWHGIRSPGNWAYKVAYQAFVRYATRLEEEPVERVSEPTAVLHRPGEAEAWLQEQEIVRALEILPPRQRQVLALTLDGWEPAEIAELLGIEGTAVRSSLLKARRAVADHLAAREEE